MEHFCVSVFDPLGRIQVNISNMTEYCTSSAITVTIIDSGVCVCVTVCMCNYVHVCECLRFVYVHWRIVCAATGKRLKICVFVV